MTTIASEMSLTVALYSTVELCILRVRIRTAFVSTCVSAQNKFSKFIDEISVDLRLEIYLKVRLCFTDSFGSDSIYLLADRGNAGAILSSIDAHYSSELIGLFSEHGPM